MFSALTKTFSVLDRLAISAFGERFNPFARLGALAVTSIVIAVVTGVLLLPFYDVNVHSAFGSVAGMLNDHPWTTGILHSVHRYSSDAAMFFSILHLFRIFATGAFRGARNLSWQTGLLAAVILWFTGWTGYWLVWDQAGFLVAQFSAQLMDALPIFGTYLGRGLLLDASINNQVFFVVFFVHMIAPLGMFVVLWVHVSRVSRPQFLVHRKFALGLTAILIALSAIYPAWIDPKADPLTIIHSVSGDFFYIFPIKLFENASPAFAWLATFLVLGFASAVPFIFRQKNPEAPSVVNPESCTACQNCYTDCPYGAIEMVPRTDGKAYATVAWVNPDRCMSCGICNGSCDTNGNNLPWFTTESVEGKVVRWAPSGDSSDRWLVFVCRDILAGTLAPDPEQGRLAELPGYRVIEVPCAGHVNPKTVRKALDSGYSGVFIASSLPGACLYREGNQWIGDRILGARKPFGRLGSAHRARVRVHGYGRGQWKQLTADAASFAKEAGEALS